MIKWDLVHIIRQINSYSRTPYFHRFREAMATLRSVFLVATPSRYHLLTAGWNRGLKDLAEELTKMEQLEVARSTPTRTIASSLKIKIAAGLTGHTKSHPCKCVQLTRPTSVRTLTDWSTTWTSKSSQLTSTMTWTWHVNKTRKWASERIWRPSNLSGKTLTQQSKTSADRRKTRNRTWIAVLGAPPSLR